MLKTFNRVSLSLALGCLLCSSLAPTANAEGIGAASAAIRPRQATANTSQIRSWFSQYDRIRRNAQMTSSEKAQSQKLIGEALNPSVSPSDKAAAKSLLRRQISRYATALRGMRSLPNVAETRALANGYYNYFRTASLLFSDLLKVSDNPLASDHGKPVLMKLGGRKAALESLDQSNKSLDSRLRRKYGIPRYRG
jgi:hypothetical protein